MRFEGTTELPGTASIDGRPEGASPVALRTGRAGVADVEVRVDQAAGGALYVEASLEDHGQGLATSNLVEIPTAP
jgi:hypothetical protein